MRIILAVVFAALVATPAMSAKLDRKCLRQLREIGIVFSDAKRICDPKNSVSNPNEYGWSCQGPSGQLIKTKGYGAKQKRDVVCE